MTTQVALPLKEDSDWGGRREGAGRPKATGRRNVPRTKRPELDRRHPVHITVRVKADVLNLRTKKRAKVVRDAIVAAGERFGCRVTQFSVQRNHIHMIAEAEDKRSLARGMQGLLIRIALGLNKLLGRKGSVFADRYHTHALKTPREVRNALAYVLKNARRHAAQVGRKMSAFWIDPFSSCRWFDGFVDPTGTRRLRPHEPQEDNPLPKAKRWLLQVGWQKAGPISIDAVPGRAG